MFNSVYQPIRVACLSLLCLSMVACSQDNAGTKVVEGYSAVTDFSRPKINVAPALSKLNLEWASTSEQRQIGLMNRASLSENAGMMFVFERSDTHCFWMKNTLIPLSVGFIDDTGRLVQIEDMSPQSTQKHCSKHATRYALEVNQGWFEQNRVTPNTQLFYK